MTNTPDRTLVPFEQVEGADIDRLARIVYEDRPFKAITPALRDATGLSADDSIPYDQFIALGGDDRGTRELIRSVVRALASSPTPIPVSGEEITLSAQKTANFEQNTSERKSALQGEALAGLIGMLSKALVERDEQRFKTVAFVYRHDILDALAALNHTPTSDQGEARAYLKEWVYDGVKCIRVDLDEKCDPWLETQKPKITPLFACTQPAPPASVEPEAANVPE